MVLIPANFLTAPSGGGSASGGPVTSGVESITGPNVDNTDPLNPVIEDIDLCAAGNFIATVRDIKGVVAYESQGGHTLQISVNGEPATFENFQNSSSTTAGTLTLNNGVNQNFNRRASTVEAITKVGDFMEITSGAVGQFAQVYVGFSDNTSYTPENNIGEYRLRLNGSTHFILDPSGAVVASGGPEQGTYRVTRTLNGLRFERNGVLLYESPEQVFDYEAGYAVTDTTLFFRGLNRFNVEEPRQEVVNNIVVTVLEDRTAAFARYSSQNNLPNTRNIVHKVRVYRLDENGGFADDFYMRYAWSGNIGAVRVNHENGTVLTEGNRAGLVTVSGVTVTELWIEFTASWGANPNWTTLDFHPNPNSAASTGVNRVIDFHYDVVPNQRELAVTDVIAGSVLIGEDDRRTSPVSINTTNIVTGFNFMQNTADLRWKVLVRDDLNSRAWQWIEIDVQSMVDRFQAGDTVDAFGQGFDDDHVRFNIIDPATGEVQLIDTGRQFEYAMSELYQIARQSSTSSSVADDPFQQPVNHAGFPNDNNLTEILATIAGELDIPDLTLDLNNQLT